MIDPSQYLPKDLIAQQEANAKIHLDKMEKILQDSFPQDTDLQDITGLTADAIFMALAKLDTTKFLSEFFQDKGIKPITEEQIQLMVKIAMEQGLAAFESARQIKPDIKVMKDALNKMEEDQLSEMLTKIPNGPAN